jgi:F-type H+-transporting ATPase subunit b
VTLHALPHLLASAITVDFDLTFLAQFVLFAAFITVLKPLLFDPLLRVFEERERRTEGAKKEAREMDAEAGELRVRYEAALEKVRHEAGRDRERLRGEAAALEAKIMAEARVEAARILETGKARIAVDVAELKKELDRARPELAAQIASRILDREVSS